jgi:hypothetical protein
MTYALSMLPNSWKKPINLEGKRSKRNHPSSDKYNTDINQLFEDRTPSIKPQD